MNSFWSYFILGFVFVLLIVVVVRGYSFMCSPSEIRTDAIKKLDAELAKEFSKPNRLGYYVFTYPILHHSGLTHSIDITIKFNKIKLKSISEIEKLHEEIYEEMIRKLNSTRTIRPFLANFPLTPDSFTLSIGFDDPKGGPVIPPYITSIAMGSSTLEFNKYKKSDTLCPFETIAEKPIHESELLRRFYSLGVERQFCEIKPEVPFVPRIESNYPRSTEKVVAFAQKLSAQNNLNFVGVGPVGENDFKSKPFEFALWGKGQLNLDSARTLASQCSRKFFDFVKTDKTCLDYMIYRSKDDFFNDTASFPELRHISFRISLWDENIDRPLAPYIAEIRFVDGKLKYFTADDVQRLVLVYEETFDDAQAFLKTQTDSAAVLAILPPIPLDTDLG